MTMSAKEKRALKAATVQESIVWATLEKLAKAEYTREELLAGKHDVAIQILAEVDGETVDLSATVKTNIQGGGLYQPSIKAPADHLLAILWSHLPETVQLQLAHDLPIHYEQHKELPAVAPEHLDAIDKLTNRLTARGPAKPKAGSITATRV
jgi:hypothetical protein